MYKSLDRYKLQKLIQEEICRQGSSFLLKKLICSYKTYKEENSSFISEFFTVSLNAFFLVQNYFVLIGYK